MKKAFLIVTVLSASRLILAPIYLAMALWPDVTIQKASIWLIPTMLITDILDGWLARKWKVASKLGYILDGLGDRAAYMVSLFVVGAALSWPDWPIYLLIFRDMALYACRASYEKWNKISESLRCWTKGYAAWLRFALIGGLLLFYLPLWGFQIPQLFTQITNLTLLNIFFGLFGIYSYFSLFIICRRYYRIP